MIFFVPGYDSATESNLAVAERILPEVCHSLLGHRATRAALISALSSEAVPLFAMAHGHPYRLLAQAGETALAEDDLSALARRSVFVYACHTATSLGEVASRNGAVWWGYTGSVTAPDSAPVFLPFFVGIFAFIRDAFPHASSPEEHGGVFSVWRSFARMRSRALLIFWTGTRISTSLPPTFAFPTSGSGYACGVPVGIPQRCIPTPLLRSSCLEFISRLTVQPLSGPG